MNGKMTITNRTRLELTWIGKENRPKLEPRILREDPAKSCHAPHRATDHAVNNGGKRWKYVLIPHDAIAENMSLAGLVSQFAIAS